MARCSRVTCDNVALSSGVYPEKESDEVFEGHLLRLRALIGKRMTVYNAEEKALRVMLEGEQEEERKRDLEKRLKKEREKLLQRKQQAEIMLFGGGEGRGRVGEEVGRAGVGLGRRWGDHALWRWGGLGSGWGGGGLWDFHLHRICFKKNNNGIIKI